VQRRKLSLLMLLVFLFLITWGGPVSASNLENYGNNSLQATITKLNENDPDVIRAQSKDFKLMWTTQHPQTNEMTSLKWVTRTQMASSSTGIKYCTVAYEFQLANYIAIWDATPFRRTTIGNPGEVMYHRVEITRSNFVQIYARNARVSEQAIEDALAREDIIHVRAYIKIYNDSNGNNRDDAGEQISMIMGNESEIESKAAMFPYENRQDMHSRFQQVQIHPGGKPRPDFFSTPEGSTRWQESYKTCAKRYSGKSGTQVKIPITLRNSGAAGATNFAASWWGAGWSNPVIPAQNVTLAENGSKALSFNVTVPAQGRETRLVFRCNTDGNTPANELNQDNNITVIEVTSNGLPGTPPGSAEDSKVGYIAVVPCTKTIFTGDYYDFKAYYHKPDGSTLEVTKPSAWEVSNSSVAKLGTTQGRVRALKPGTLVLSATYKGMTGTADVTVIDEPLPPPPNYSPKADFTISNAAPVEGEKVSLRDESTHEGRRYGESIISWEWTVEGYPGSNSQNAEAAWNEVGTYRITLRVEDQDGDSDSCTKSVVVGPALPAAVIQVDPGAIILGRKININGDQSTAANGRSIKWDEMQWEFTKPGGNKVTFTGRYPTPDRATTNALVNQTGIWKVRLKVKDSDDNESEWAEDVFTVYPDNPPQARFWSVTETLRCSYENNEITVRDLSTPGNPDAALGDQITARQWTLYYDSNNNGVFADPEDEIMLPGQLKSAQIVQQSGNDPNPKIKFYKTGLYKLELSITESYLDDWDNTFKTGLSANTDSMPEAEKSIMVINIAPTVAFDIIKKTPVDVQFAVDYTVSDEKFSSLLSADAGFKSQLTGGCIVPTTGMQKVATGQLGDLWTGAINPSAPYNDFKEVPVSGMYDIVNRSNWMNPEYKSFNIDTGVTGSETGILEILNDGNLMQGVFDLTYWWGNVRYVKSVKKVNQNLNVLLDYAAAINNACPADETIWIPALGRTGTFTYYHELYPTLKGVPAIYVNNDGSLFLVYSGVAPNNPQTGYPQHSYASIKIVKINPNLSIAYSRTHGPFNRTPDISSTVTAKICYHFPQTNQLILRVDNEYLRHPAGYNTSLYSYGDYNNKFLAEVASSGSNNTLLSSTSNKKYLVFAGIPKIFTIDEFGSLVLNIPSGYGYAENIAPGPNIVGPWMPGKSVVVYTGVTYVPKNPSGLEAKDRITIYIIDENTGTLEKSKELVGACWAGSVPWSGDSGGWTSAGFGYNTGGVLNNSLLGIGMRYTYTTGYGGYDSLSYTFINADLQPIYNSGIYSFPYGAGATQNLGIFHPINEQFAGLIHTISNTSDPTYNQSEEFLIDSTGIVTSFPKVAISEQASWPSGSRIWKAGNYLYTKENGILQLMDSSLVPLWNRNVTDGSIITTPVTSFEGACHIHDLFNDVLVMSKDKSVLLVNPYNGQTLKTIPHEYFFHDETHLVCYGINSSGQRDGTLRGYGQLQGLQYLRQVINDHPWDGDKYNFIVSVIDGKAFSDYSNLSNPVVTDLKARHLKFTGISPQVGQTKAQIQTIAQAAEGGWWINTNNNMSVPLNELGDKIIQAVNEERGADNIVLVNQEVELRAKYFDAENDPAERMQWSFAHDPNTLNGIPMSNIMGLTAKTPETANPLLTQFAAPGTWKAYCKAKDYPNTTVSYMNHLKAGSKWSNEDAYLTVIVHRKPVANFTVLNAASNKPGNQLVIQDNSYDPDLQYTDPMSMKGLRVWEWQYRKDGGNWKTEYCYDNSGPRGFTTSGKYELRLRVKDNFGAWSDWTDTSPITIINRPPVADFTVVPNPVAISRQTMITDCSYDPDGDPIVSYDWIIEISPGVTEQFIRNNPASFPYAWPLDGEYPITLTVTDSEGLSATVTKPVTVSPRRPPAAVIRIPDEVFTDEWFTADGTGSRAFDGSTVVKAYWQHLKPGALDWTNVHEQDIAALNPGEVFLHYPIFPKGGEHGKWRIRLLVQDSEGLYSEIAEAEFTVQEGWQITGRIVPEVGERGRKMRIEAYAYRKGKPNERYTINSMNAELAYMDAACAISGRAAAEGIETLNMPYDAGKADFRVTYLVGQKIYEANRWPADGTYYIKITGQKGTTRKTIALPFSIKGNIWERFYIRTYSW